MSGVLFKRVSVSLRKFDAAHELILLENACHTGSDTGIEQMGEVAALFDKY